MVLVNSLRKMVDDLSYRAGVTKDYSREIHDDPDKRERFKELDQIIKEINDIEMYYFSEIKDNVNELKTELKTEVEKESEKESEGQSTKKESEDKV